MTADTATAPASRVVMVAHSHILGGIERHVVALSRELTRRGHQVAYAGPLRGWMGEQMRAGGHECLDLPMHGMYDPLSAWRLARFARRWGADVLHGHAMRGARYADWARRWSGVPAVVSAHSTAAWRWFRPWMHIVAVSGAVRDHLVERGLPAQRIAVVYNGIVDPPAPADAPAAARPVRPTTERPLTIGLVGRLEPVKGQDVALQAMARLADRTPARLLLAGTGPSAWAASLPEMAASLGVAGQVEFLGQVDDIPGLLARLDVLVAPSRREAMPMALIEACAAGLPIVASRIGGVPEVVADGESGLLVPVEDAAALATAIDSLARDPDRRARFGQVARERYVARFTAHAMCEGIEAVYSAAIDEARHGHGQPASPR